MQNYPMVDFVKVLGETFARFKGTGGCHLNQSFDLNPFKSFGMVAHLIAGRWGLGLRLDI